MSPQVKVLEAVAGGRGTIFDIGFKDGVKKWVLKEISMTTVDKLVVKVKKECKKNKKWPRINRTIMGNKGKAKNVLDKKKRALQGYFLDLIKIDAVWKSKAFTDFLGASGDGGSGGGGGSQKKGRSPRKGSPRKGLAAVADKYNAADLSKSPTGNEQFSFGQTNDAPLHQRRDTEDLLSSAMQNQENERLKSLNEKLAKLAGDYEKERKEKEEALQKTQEYESQKTEYLKEAETLREHNRKISQTVEDLKAATKKKESASSETLHEQREELLEKIYALRTTEKSLREKGELLQQKEANLQEKEQENRQLVHKLNSYRQEVDSLTTLKRDLLAQLESQEDAMNAQAQHVSDLEDMTSRFEREREELTMQLSELEKVAKACVQEKDELDHQLRRSKQDLKYAKEEIALAEGLSAKRGKKSQRDEDAVSSKKAMEYEQKIKTLEAELTDTKRMVDRMPESTKVQARKMLEKEKRITLLEAQTSEQQVEIRKLEKQAEIEMESVRRKNNNRQTMLEEQLRGFTEDVEKSTEHELRDELAHTKDSREQERLKFRTEINELQSQLEAATSKLGQETSAHQREIEALKSGLGDVDLGSIQERPTRQETVPSGVKDTAAVATLQDKIEDLELQLQELKQQVVQSQQQVREAVDSKVTFINISALEMEKLRNVIRQLSGGKEVSLKALHRSQSIMSAPKGLPKQLSSMSQGGMQKDGNGAQNDFPTYPTFAGMQMDATQPGRSSMSNWQSQDYSSFIAPGGGNLRELPTFGQSLSNVSQPQGQQQDVKTFSLADDTETNPYGFADPGGNDFNLGGGLGDLEAL